MKSPHPKNGHPPKCKELCISLFVCLFWNSIWLCNSGGPGTHYVDQVGLKLIESYLHLPSNDGIIGVYHHSWPMYFLVGGLGKEHAMRGVWGLRVMNWGGLADVFILSLFLVLVSSKISLFLSASCRKGASNGRILSTTSGESQKPFPQLVFLAQQERTDEGPEIWLLLPFSQNHSA